MYYCNKSKLKTDSVIKFVCYRIHFLSLLENCVEFEMPMFEAWNKLTRRVSFKNVLSLRFLFLSFQMILNMRLLSCSSSHFQFSIGIVIEYYTFKEQPLWTKLPLKYPKKSFREFPPGQKRRLPQQFFNTVW